MSLSFLPRVLRRAPRRFAFHYERVLGTALELQVVAAHERVARDAERAVLAEIDRLDAILSGWTDTSEFARWRATPGVRAAVSRELADVLEMAAAWHERTRGAFDPSMAAGSRLWTLGDDRRSATCLTTQRLSLDAIAKGYIVERAATCAAEIDGVSQVLVNVGGDLRHIGDRAVSVAITDPRAPADNASPLAIVRLRNAALATSGGYHRGTHIIDPRTRRPAEHVLSASVIAPDCTTADALSTAFSVLAPHESIALADALPDVACLLVADDAVTHTSARWTAHVDLSTAA